MKAHSPGARIAVVAAVAATGLLTACAPSSTPVAEDTTTTESSPTTPAEDFDLDALVAAAQAEGKKLTVYDSTGKVKDIAENFEKKYGIETEGIKSDAAETVEKMIREAKAGNVTIDAAVISDIPSITKELFPQDVAVNWVPPDLASTITQKDPLVAVMSPAVWAYNDEAYPNGCPINSMWDLVDPAWKGKVGISDPLDEPHEIDWFNEMAINGSDALTAAYKKDTGKDLQLTEENAGWEWVKRLAENEPKVYADEEAIAAAIGTRGQKAPPVGMLSVAKFRDLADKNYAMKICSLDPWSGYAYPKSIVMAKGTDAPNSAKLWIHFMMTAEGVAPQVNDGKMSGNSAVPPASDDPSGIVDHRDELLVFSTKSAEQNWDMRPDMQDFWRIHHAG